MKRRNVKQAMAVTALCAVVSMAGVSAATATRHGTNVPGTHYLCYSVDPHGKFSPVVAILADQFPPRFKTKVVRPVSVCTPVSKNNSQIYDKRIHLVCYQIRPRKKVESKYRTVDMFNQFGQQRFTVVETTTLCVPSYKKRVK
jgi:hypothetical protein